MEGINELKKREKDLDIKISQFILDNFKSKKLYFYSMHPTNILLEYICHEILKNLNFSTKLTIKNTLLEKLMIRINKKSNFIHEYLENPQFPNLPRIYKTLDLKFHRSKKIIYQSQEMSSNFFIEKSFKFYEQNIQYLDYNINGLIPIWKILEN